MTELIKPKCESRERYDDDDYRQMLDDCFDEANICGHNYTPSHALETIDPIAYRCGFADYQEYEDVYICPICGAEEEEEDDATYCCQEEEEQQ